MNPFRRVEFVLVEPKYEGNIGAVARVIHNLGFSRLVLVKPRTEIGSEARKYAYHSQSILKKARICSDLSQAIGDAGLVIGTTRRRGNQRGFPITPREMAQMAVPIARLNNIALVFGSEDSGLSTRDLALCHWIVKIPSPSPSDSFNLSQAVAIVGYELSFAFQDFSSYRRAQSRALEAFFRRLEILLRKIEFLREPDPSRMMIKIRRVFSRAGLNENELRIFQGIVTQALKKISPEYIRS